MSESGNENSAVVSQILELSAKANRKNGSSSRTKKNSTRCAHSSTAQQPDRLVRRASAELETEREEERLALEVVYQEDFRVERRDDAVIGLTIKIRPSDVSVLRDPNATGSVFVPLPGFNDKDHGDNDQENDRLGGFEHVSFYLTSWLTEEYPATPPVIDVVDEHCWLSSEDRRRMRDRLEEAADFMSKTEGYMMYRLVNEARDMFQAILEERLASFNDEIVILSPSKWRYRRRGEVTNTVLKFNRDDYNDDFEHDTEDEDEEDDAAVAERVRMCDRMLHKNLACDDNVVDPESYRRWVREYCARVGDRAPRRLTPDLFVGVGTVFRALREKGYGVVGLENVMRNDLAVDFFERWHDYGGRHGDERCSNVVPTTAFWAYQGGNGSFSVVGGGKGEGAPRAQPVMAFHGTPTERTGSVVRNGLVVPGDGSGMDVRCGSSYGVGIYVSPNADTSVHYNDGSGQLIVCAVLLGRPWTARCRLGFDERRVRRDFDSHTDPTGFDEWVLFGRSCVLPCWMVEYCELRDDDFDDRCRNSFSLSQSGMVVRKADPYSVYGKRRKTTPPKQATR